jgi:hypothetical protein
VNGASDQFGKSVDDQSNTVDQLGQNQTQDKRQYRKKEKESKDQTKGLSRCPDEFAFAVGEPVLFKKIHGKVNDISKTYADEKRGAGEKNLSQPSCHCRPEVDGKIKSKNAEKYGKNQFVFRFFHIVFLFVWVIP